MHVLVVGLIRHRGCRCHRAADRVAIDDFSIPDDIFDARIARCYERFTSLVSLNYMT